MKAKKPKRRGLADMDFGEGLARLIQTKPEEVLPPPGKERKRAKAKRSSEPPTQDQKGRPN
jgi:hypothetical protein